MTKQQFFKEHNEDIALLLAACLLITVKLIGFSFSIFSIIDLIIMLVIFYISFQITKLFSKFIQAKKYFHGELTHQREKVYLNIIKCGYFILYMLLVIIS